MLSLQTCCSDLPVTVKVVKGFIVSVHWALVCNIGPPANFVDWLTTKQNIKH